MHSFGVMDYSLLVGIHNIDKFSKEGSHHKTPSGSQQGLTAMQDVFEKRMKHTGSFHNRNLLLELIGDNESGSSSGIPAVNKKGERLWVYVGIIDILVEYRTRKKLEHAYKSLVYDGKTVSVVHPGFYASRFIDFMRSKVFSLDECKDTKDWEVSMDTLHETLKNFTTSVPSQYRRFARKGSVSNVDDSLPSLSEGSESEGAAKEEKKAVKSTESTISTSGSKVPPPAITVTKGEQTYRRRNSKLKYETTENEEKVRREVPKTVSFNDDPTLRISALEPEVSTSDSDDEIDVDEQSGKRSGNM